MEKMNKKMIAITVMPETKKKLDEMRLQTGLPLGAIIDKLVKENGQVKGVVHADA